jgi:hypothetical protein
MQSRTSARRVAMACTDMRATMSESRTREVTYSLHSEGDRRQVEGEETRQVKDGWKERQGE